ncbi:MAG: beta-lactamase family protein [Clostridia bacterium]|nr:beta-lactamase family protein [Clostridia bacterium]
MKKLNNTELLIAKKLKENSLESYAVIVGYNDDEWMLTSNDVDLDTYFDAASIGKVFPTTTLALKAVDEGLLSFDDTLDRFFPNVPKDKKSITVKHLMTHTSGMYRKEFPDNVAERGRDSIADFILGVPLEYEIGTKSAYCCTGMVLLGFIVEKVYGLSLDQAFEKLLCKPLGLTRSRYSILPDEPNAVNCNHKVEIQDIRYDDYNVRRMNGIPAGPGGNYITAGDLRKFVKAIIGKDERLYSKKMFELAEKNYTGGFDVCEAQRGVDNRALGYVYVTKNSPEACDLFPDGSIGHTGWTGQSFFINRNLNLYVILLSNATRCTAKKYGKVNYDEVCEMRAEFHRAIKKDFGL